MGAAGAAPVGSAVADPLPAAAARTSALVMRPPRAVPATPARSTPSAAAIRWATGETLAPLPVGGAAGAVSAGAVSAGALVPAGDGAGADCDGAAAPALIRAITCPTVTVSPSSARISVIVPEAGAGSSMSTLSVEISTTVSPSLTASPTLTDHSRIVPSVTDSPPVGVTMSIVLAAAPLLTASLAA